MLPRATVLALAVLQCWPAGAKAEADPSSICAHMVAATEHSTAVPPQLLHTIALVESGRRDPRTGITAPWPWTINAEGLGLFFDTREQAIAVVQTLQARGVRSIDVGCMQINLMYHPNAFASLEQAFEPQANVRYAAHFLQLLFGQTGNWPKAAAAYHSQTPEIGADYERQVMALWPLAARYADPAPPPVGSHLTVPLQETALFAQRLAEDAADRQQLYAMIHGPVAPPRKTLAGGRPVTKLASLRLGWHAAGQPLTALQ